MKKSAIMLALVMAFSMYPGHQTYGENLAAAPVESISDTFQESLPPVNTNLLLDKPAQANSVEVSYLGPEKAVDGNFKDKSSRWSFTKKGSQGASMLTVDMGIKRPLKQFTIYWERRNATNYEIRVSDNQTDWSTVFTKESYPEKLREVIRLDTSASGRYVQLKVNDFVDLDPDHIVSWPTCSIYELEAYHEIPFTMQDAAESIVPEIKDGDTMLAIPVVTVPDGIKDVYQVEFLGADYEQIIDYDRKIYKPLTDRTVQLSFKLTNQTVTDQNGNHPVYYMEPVTITVPGKYAASDTDKNKKPSVSPELTEWYGKSGNFTITNESRIIISGSELLPMAQTFAADYKEIVGRPIDISIGSTASSGDFLFRLIPEGTGLKEEGYLMEIGSYVSIDAETATGSYWSTRTILQILKQTKTTIPQGTVRDYPRYKVRGLVVDVARKPFSKQFLEDVMKNLSWYKMNDFQVHLQDNFIFLEDLKEPMQGYSGFRLESDIVGDNGIPLTSVDEFYTKDWFRQYIKASEVRGVNIVPEIDAPAHALQIIKAFPDLCYGLKPGSGNSNRKYDKLDIIYKQTEVVNLMQRIFNEYLTGEEPVFPVGKTVHVGTDEFVSGAGVNEAFRQFTDKMLRFIQSSGRTVRMWGSLDSNSGTTEVVSDQVQVNLWYNGYQSPTGAFLKGYDLINTNDATLYLVPGAGYYHDYLDTRSIYNTWQANNVAGDVIPVGSKQMLGGAFALWNDLIDVRSNGIGQIDAYDRIKDVIPAFSEKLWGKGEDKSFEELTKLASKLGEAPGSNPRHEINSKTDEILNFTFDDTKDHSGNGYDGVPVGAELTSSGQEGGGLRLNGGNSYFELPLESLGLPSTLEVWVKKDAGSGNGEQILFESDKGAIKAVQKNTGKVGFSREEYDYSFDYVLPEDQWVKLAFQSYLGRKSKTELYVNDVLQQTLQNVSLGDGGPAHMFYSMLIPLNRIGSRTNAFCGEVDGVKVYYGQTAPTDSEKLNQMVQYVKNLNQFVYCPSSWDKVESALTKAAGASSEGEIREAINGLSGSIDQLELIETVK